MYVALQESRSTAYLLLRIQPPNEHLPRAISPFKAPCIESGG